MIRGWLPLMILPPAVLALRNLFADWVFMWLLAFAIFFGCKWITWHGVDRAAVSRIRSLAYLMAWPGMDAREFLTQTPIGHVHSADWARAAGKTILGLGLLLLAARGTVESPFIAGWAGWVGMTGTILALHFGVFKVLALLYSAAGIAAKPLMRSPVLAVSLSDFWGNRWNVGFNQLAYDLVFRPLVHTIGVARSTFLVFIVSGLVHDLVISLPARGGYGLPTVYFALQGIAVLFERSRAGRALGLRRGWRGRLFMLVVTISPVPILFHSAFVTNIVLPMLQAIGGIWGKP